MNKNEILRLSNSIKQQINQGRLHDAFMALRQLSEQAMAYEITDAVKQCEQTYAYMLRYLAEGTSDPSRQAVYDGVVVKMRELLDCLVRRLLIPETPSLYYNTLRTLRLRNEDSVAQAVQSYISLLDLTPADTSQLRDRERIERHLFNLIWVQFPFSTADTGALRMLLVSDASAHVKAMAVGAVTLGLLEFYDRNRMLLLIDAYQNDDRKVAVRGLVGLLIGLFRYRNRKLDKEVAERLDLLRDTPDWQANLTTAFTELARTRDTERLTRKLTDEVLPGLMKEGRDMINRFRDEGLTPEDMAENPHWEEMLDKSGLADKIRQFSEIQEEGGDVYMAAFSRLKQFPFFNEVANWFTPFTNNRSEFADLGDNIPLMASLLVDAPVMCDSDKYSMILSMSMMPRQQSGMMLDQLKAQADQLREAMRHTTENTDVNMRTLINAYVLDLYRFFKLFRRKGEFFNPFDGTFNLIRVKALESDFTDAAIVEAMAEVYFKIGAWSDARYLYDRLNVLKGPSAMSEQKIAYCYESEGDFDKALEHYQRALEFEEADSWTLRRLAAMMMRVGRYADAAQVYDTLERLRPDDANVALRSAYALIELGRYADAINKLYKVEYFEENGTRHLRPLAWAQMLAGDRDAAARTYSRILSHGAQAMDYVNMGHLAWADGNLRETINYYQLALEQFGRNVGRLTDAINADSDALQTMGVNTADLPLIIDAILYTL